MNKNSIVSLCAGAFALIGCGGSSDGGGGGSCPAVTACGGTIVPGTYAITSMCVHSDTQTVDTGSTCSGVTMSLGSVSASGTYTFTEDNRYSTTGTMSMTMSMKMPAACLTTNGVTLTCSQLDAVFKQTMASQPDAPPMSLSCSGSKDCNCDVQMKDMPINESGTYSTSGNEITMTSESDPTGSTSTYCVSGNQIILNSTGSSSTTVSSANITGEATMVLTRQ